MASFDAWIKYYRPDENSANTSISYYSKGAVLAFLLDARIQRATRGARTLDDVMRLAYERYSGAQGYSPEDFKALVDDVAGPAAGIRAWFAGAVESAGDLDYREALDWFGLRFREPVRPAPRASLGLSTRNDEGRLVISAVRRDGPAAQAGLNVDDEILAIDEFRIRATQLDTRLAQYQPGTMVSVLVARREELRRIDVRLGGEPPRQWQLEVAPSETPEQRRRRETWHAPS
jgi:predicted metalloprotease with PDZ domain